MGESESTVSQGVDHLTFWLTRPDEQRPKRYVYVIRAKGASPIKVGRAHSVMQRMNELQTGNWLPLRLLHVVPGWTELEWQLHQRLSDSRISGEWFDGDAIPGFLQFAHGLADQMVDGFKLTGEVPDFRSIGEGWFHRGKNGSVAEQRFTNEPIEKIGRLSSAREDERFARCRPDNRDLRFKHAAEEVPTFSPHRPQ